ncbi:intradiol ring-cleavage dioxygenase : Protocatechuate 3,4-dioxygenase beta subunit OS=Singulisphaera acidiphila (strain ATCC BAA-1392 / DSM 18658 / VKM B-2454 / MOB10) GN=Sinac_5427 PE=4 SV=1: Dioxygenase_C [Gemmata massiliana]|uniref:Intradiol ring-cleavage dioxygenases domain-containing protein n=1 Tax=Gemmata massiliana TaxID=1210884 RepID=A0A6P2DHG2_9BACT|nr:protocatechuate 3,4-dioxygenase [Gemmata massiliana]VTS01863.1 intradiol ring-cleavage dioxygenase : Protocatechuate 3,4-dioxygenase beta subunit OS=Singulisphaera acidiphila (strain ATCC BAA-1392 / DSM 18658 / VKM B-2454 / MOB10) GN=Sinac_5427 PE=4 SV=1: Dioxygenase_C [Gemmata massiliana]
MSSPLHLPNRRLFLASAAVAATSPFWTVRGAFAEELTRTPAQTEGPFYPNKLPLDTDNDLLIINDGITPAVGDITHLTGKVLDAKGNPLKNAVVEIWQCDAKGVYLHTGDSAGKKDQQDKNFQGFGRFVTGKTGEYYFRTIKPVPYPGRTPHIHFKIKQGKKELLTTQLYVKGDPGNEKDGIWKGVRNEKQRDAITVDFEKVKGSKTGELAANFVVILGVTPAE